MKKCLFVISLVIVILFGSFTYIYADSDAWVGLEDSSKNDVRNWSFGYNSSQTLPDTIASLAGLVIKVIQTFTIIATVLVTILLGFKYMMSSLDERAANKRQFMNIIIGAVMACVVSSVVALIFDSMNVLINT
jgi:hypothetical protein